VIDHFADVPAPSGERQVIHASHFLSKGADVEIVDCLPQFAPQLPGRYGFENGPQNQPTIAWVQ
jgi:hypothetical protein